MPGQNQASACGYHGGVHSQGSVEERITFFTSYTGVMCPACVRPTKRWSLSHNGHYATKTRLLCPFLAARMGDRGGIFCRIRDGVGGGGCSGMIFYLGAGAGGDAARIVRKILEKRVEAHGREF